MRHQSRPSKNHCRAISPAPPAHSRRRRPIRRAQSQPRPRKKQNASSHHYIERQTLTALGKKWPRKPGNEEQLMRKSGIAVIRPVSSLARGSLGEGGLSSVKSALLWYSLQCLSPLALLCHVGCPTT